MRVDDDYSGFDAPGKYDANEGLHTQDVNRIIRSGQLSETLLSHPGPRTHPTTCDDDGVNDTKQQPEPDRSAAPPSGPFTFRVSQLALFVVITLTICVTPLAISKLWLLELYLIPVLLWRWIRRIATTVDDEGITATGIFRSRRVAWDEVTALRLRTRSRVSVVCSSGPELSLPAVHVRDLPLLAVCSGGRIPDPTAPADATPPLGTTVAVEQTSPQE